MEYSRLAGVYGELEQESAKLRKTGIISDLLKECSKEDLPMVTMLLQGRVFPAWSEREIGIASLLMIKALTSITGYDEKRVQREFNETGDLGLVAERLVKEKRQSTLFRRELSVEKVFSNLRDIAGVEGKNSQSRKFQLVSELISSAKPQEAKYIIRTVLGDLRIGVAEGIVRDAIAKAFFGDLEGDEYKEALKAVEWAWFIRPDYGEVASLAKDKGLRGLRKVSLEVGKPYMVLLAERSGGLDEAMEAFDKPGLEFKYDGARLCIHKKRDQVWLFTRRLEDVTKQFPEVVKAARKSLQTKECIVEGEMVAYDKEGRPRAFQHLSQRIKRKYDIEKVQEEIPVSVDVFDITFLEGEDLFGEPLSERWGKLRDSLREGKTIRLARHRETSDKGKAGEFYQRALDMGHEGLIVKNMEATYHPGRRVAGGWLKVKPIMENLDLVIMGATWGTGKRAGWLGSLVLGCRDPDGGFRECGMIGTGIKEKGEEGVTFSQLTDLLRPNIESEKGSKVTLKPSVVVEVAYEEIQKSPNYSSGYALRFPRVLRIREDRSPRDADTVERVERLYQGQRGRK